MGQIPGAQVCLFIELGQIGTTPHRFCPEISSSFLFVLTTDMSTGSKIIHSYSWILGHQTKDSEDVKRNYAIFGLIPGKFHRAAGREDKH